MSYRTKVKSDSNGTLVDLPLDAETVKGEDVVNTKQTKLTTTSVSDGTINKVIGFDSNGNIVKATQSGGSGGSTVTFVDWS